MLNELKGLLKVSRGNERLQGCVLLESGRGVGRCKLI